MIRLVYQRGEFTPAQTTLVATALFWFAFSLPTNGLFLLLTRTFFSLQRPWMPTAIAAVNLVGHGARRARPLQASASAGSSPRRRSRTAASVVAQAVILRRDARRPRARPAVSTRGSGSRSPRRRWRRSASASGTCSTRPSAAASSARSSRSAAGWARRRSSTSPPPSCCGSPSSTQIMRLLRGAARCSDLGALPARRRRARSARRVRLARRRRRCAGGCCREFDGAPAHLATSVLALALSDLGWPSSRELWSCSSRCRICCRCGGRAVALWTLAAAGRAGEGVDSDSRPGEDDLRYLRRTRGWDRRLRALWSAAGRGRPFRRGRPRFALDRDDRLRLDLVPRAVRGRVSTRAATPGTCTSSRPSSSPGSTRPTLKSSTRSGCSPSAETCSRRC